MSENKSFLESCDVPSVRNVLADMCKRLQTEIGLMEDEQSKYRNMGDKVIADYISHKLMGFQQAVAIVLDALARLD